jgi:hypothetical protein
MQVGRGAAVTRRLDVRLKRLGALAAAALLLAIGSLQHSSQSMRRQSQARWLSNASALVPTGFC